MATQNVLPNINQLAIKAVDLLKRMIATPSVSRDEAGAASVVRDFLRSENISYRTLGNNTWAFNLNFDPKKPTLLLNSHIDTVKPSPSYTRDPFTPTQEGDKLYGLGSNDAGASVVSLATAFAQLYTADDLPVNLLLALTAEEEVMGENGMRAFLPKMSDDGVKIDMAIVGEPTGMHPAIAERGLVVLDCVAHGVTGHAARNEGVNALYIALDDITRLREMAFDRISPTLGPIKVTVTQIQAGRQHNVVPEECSFVVDVRTTDAYTNEETVEILRHAIQSDAYPRSTRIRASVIDAEHPLVKGAVAAGGTPYVSPTTSDMALMAAFPSLKIGPGESSRSHSSDEYVLVSEIADAIPRYIEIIKNLAI